MSKSGLLYFLAEKAKPSVRVRRKATDLLSSGNPKSSTSRHQKQIAGLPKGWMPSEQLGEKSRVALRYNVRANFKNERSCRIRKPNKGCI